MELGSNSFSSLCVNNFLFVITSELLLVLLAFYGINVDVKQEAVVKAKALSNLGKISFVTLYNFPQIWWSSMML